MESLRFRESFFLPERGIIFYWILIIDKIYSNVQISEGREIILRELFYRVKIFFSSLLLIATLSLYSILRLRIAVLITKVVTLHTSEWFFVSNIPGIKVKDIQRKKNLPEETVSTNRFREKLTETSFRKQQDDCSRRCVPCPGGENSFLRHWPILRYS
jgi:hypothetical protein